MISGILTYKRGRLRRVSKHKYKKDGDVCVIVYANKPFESGWRVHSVNEVTGDVVHERYDGVRMHETVKGAKIDKFI